MRTRHALIPVAVSLAGLDGVAAKCGSPTYSAYTIEDSTNTSAPAVESSTSTCVPPSNPYLVSIPTSIPTTTSSAPESTQTTDDFTNSDTTTFVVTSSSSETPSTPASFSDISSTTPSSTEATTGGCPPGTAPSFVRGGTVCVPVERRRSSHGRK